MQHRSGSGGKRGFGQALVAVTLDRWVHQLADFRAILGDIGRDRSVVLVPSLDGEPHFDFLDALAAEASHLKKRFAPVPSNHLIDRRQAFLEEQRSQARADLVERIAACLPLLGSEMSLYAVLDVFSGELKRQGNLGMGLPGFPGGDHFEIAFAPH
ncbi:MAG: hypothetical protein J5X23_10140 [Candidatus Accumulibacter sp.]|nr:hypothetical protein [Accumulibacter sp.]